MLKQRRTVIRLVAASSRRPLRISAAVSKKFGPYCWLVDYLRGSKIEFPDIGFGILSHTLVFSIVGQQWQSYYGLVHSISYHEELLWRIFDGLCQCYEWLWHSLFYLLNVSNHVVPTLRFQVFQGKCMGHFPTQISSSGCLLLIWCAHLLQADAETFQVVSAVIAEQLAIDVNDVRAESKFTDLGADSLDTVSVLWKTPRDLRSSLQIFLARILH
jgi:hypothetical protein